MNGARDPGSLRWRAELVLLLLLIAVLLGLERLFLQSIVGED